MISRNIFYDIDDWSKDYRNLLQKNREELLKYGLVSLNSDYIEGECDLVEDVKLLESK